MIQEILAVVTNSTTTTTTHTTPHITAVVPPGDYLLGLPSLLLFMLAPMAMGVFVVYVLITQGMGKNAKMLWYIKRKKGIRAVFHIGLDRAMQILPAKRGINGNLHIGVIDFMPDPTMPDASFPLGHDGIIAMLTHAHSASTLNPSFLEYAAFATKNLSKTNNPRDAAIALSIMMRDEKYSTDRLTLFKQIYSGQKTLEEIKQAEATRLTLDETSKLIFFSQFEKDYGYDHNLDGSLGELKTEERITKVEKLPDVKEQIPVGIIRLEKHLADVQKAKLITEEKRNWYIQPTTDTKTLQTSWSLVQITQTPVDYVRYFLPNGATPNDVHCAEENEVIYCPNGIKYAKELKEGDETLGGKVEQLGSFYDETFKVKSGVYGVTFEANGEHPMFVRNKMRLESTFKRIGLTFKNNTGGWRSLESLYEKEQARKNKYHHVFQKLLNPNEFKFHEKSIGERYAKFMGYLASDGNWDSKPEVNLRPGFTNTNPDLITDMRTIGKELGFRISDRKNQSKGHENAQTIYFCSREGVGHSKKLETIQIPFYSLIDELGLRDKDTFGKLQILPINELKMFIQGFFNGDGCLVVHPGYAPWFKFSVGLSKRRTDELQFMLWRLGIRSRIGFKDEPNSKCYEVFVDEVENSNKLISILEDRKYPEKFAKAREELPKWEGHGHYPDQEGIWIPLSKIERTGKKRVIGWKANPSHTIVGRLGMLSHNSYGANKEIQGQMEKEFTTSTAMKWFTLGFVGLLLGVGVYIILQGLHI